MTRLVLASKSKGRAAMLEAAGIPVDLHPADIDERALDDRWTSEGLGPDQVALRLAEEKAKAVSLARPGRYVIGADQTLALGNRRFSKPASRAQAREHLLAFRAKIHHLHSGFAVARDGKVLFSDLSSAAMHVRDFSDAFLDGYLAEVGDDVMSSVGCYKIESIGINLFDRVDGDHFTIIGMPLISLLSALRRNGIIAS